MDFRPKVIHNNIYFDCESPNCTPVNIYNMNFKYSVCSLRNAHLLDIFMQLKYAIICICN